MKEYIALDSHKYYSILEQENKSSGKCRQVRINHERGAIMERLKGVEAGTPVAVEATGNWYWIVDEIEQAGCVPQLVHPRKAKLMMGMVNKTDKLDVHGLNRLQRTETLPTVWIASSNLRDMREMTRTRMALVRHRTQLKNRILATLSKYGLVMKNVSDSFGKKGRQQINELISTLPPHTSFMTGTLLEQLDFVCRQIKEAEVRLREALKPTTDMNRIQTLPGIGEILAAVITLEIGDVHRFASAERLASYSGTTPRVHASGDKIRYGQLRQDVNHYLKWAFTEAANSIARYAARHSQRHASQLYWRIRNRRGHQKAIGAVARHLAEATFYVLLRQEEYKEPSLKKGHSMGM